MNTPLFKMTTTDTLSGRAYNPTNLTQVEVNRIKDNSRYTVHSVEKLKITAEQMLSQVTGFGKPY